MTTPIRHDFHTDIANSILQDIQYQQSNYYYFLGKIDSWGLGDISPTVDAIDSDYQNNLVRSNMLYINKIGPNDVSVVARRYNWVPGIVYAHYDNTIDMMDLNFYVVTQDNNVYKCLDNANGAQSTSQPVGSSYYSIRTPDGYLWKYMYTIPSFKRSRFMSLNYIPVQNALTDSFYSKGAVDSVIVSNSGSGYASTPLTTISVVGSTVGSGATGTILTGVIGNIIGFNLVSGGSGYTAGCKIAITTLAGTGAVITPVIVGGVVTSVIISSAGVGYSDGDVMVFSVGGIVLVPEVSTITGSITSVKIVNPGIGYVTPPTLTVESVGGGYSGKYGNPTALISPVMYNGSLVGVNILDPGINYSADLSTTITVQGNGSNAKFTPVIHQGSVVDVIVEDPGEGYTEIVLSVNGIGTGAKLSAVLSTSDFISNQSVVEQTAIPGAIYSIKVLAGGNNYSQSTVAIISGDGTGCTATPVIDNGQITHVIVNTFGQDYTYAGITFSDAGRQVFGDNIDATAHVILSPIGGHGFDSVTELFGTTLAITSSLRQDDSLNTIFQDYRQFGLIKNPTDILTNKRYTSHSSLITYSVNVDSVVGVVIDEILLFQDVKFRVVSVSGSTITLQQLGVKYIEPIGTLVAEAENTRTYTSLGVESYPSVNKYSGKLLYSTNENPFSFTEDQGITIKTFLQF